MNKSGEILRKNLSLLKNDDTKNWLDFNFKFANERNLNNFILYTLVSIILGVFIGIIYVLVLNAVNEKAKSSKIGYPLFMVGFPCWMMTPAIIPIPAPRII